MKNNISECPCCTRSTTNQSGVVSAFHLNKDSATSLLAQILYETIGNEKKKEEKIETPIINIDFFGNNLASSSAISWVSSLLSLFFSLFSFFFSLSSL